MCGAGNERPVRACPRRVARGACPNPKAFRGERGSSFSLDVEFTAASRLHHSVRRVRRGQDDAAGLHCRIASSRARPDRHCGGPCCSTPTRGVNLPPNRRSVGYLLQSLALFPHMTVRQNVQYGLARAGSVRARRPMPRNSGVVSHRWIGAAAAARTFRRRTSARGTGAHAGNASSSLAARRAAHRAGRCHANRRLSPTCGPGIASSGFLSSMSRISARKFLRWARASLR